MQRTTTSGMCGATRWLALAGMLFLAGCGRPAPPTAPKPAGIRVVSLAPNLTEIVCAIGAADRLVGRTDVCRHPPDMVGNIPIVGGFGTPSLEMLVSLKPTLVLEVDLEDKSMGQKIDRLGLSRKRIPCSTLADIPSAIRTTGELLQHEPAARALADLIAGHLAALDTGFLATNAPAVYAEIWNDPLMTAGKKSIISDLIRLAGGRNLGDEVAEKDYFNVSSEWVVARNPDVIISLTTADKALVREQVARRTGWNQIKAVRDGRIYQSSHSDTLTIPGPRVLEGIAELRQFIGQK